MREPPRLADAIIRVALQTYDGLSIHEMYNVCR